MGSLPTCWNGCARCVAPDPTPAHRARSFARQVSGRTLEPVGPSGEGVVLADPRDGFASVAAIADRDGAVLHLGALNARRELEVAA